MERSDAVAVAVAVRKKCAHLQRFASDITSCRVVIDKMQRHKHQGRPFAVRIELRRYRRMTRRLSGATFTTACL